MTEPTPPSAPLDPKIDPKSDPKAPASPSTMARRSSAPPTPGDFGGIDRVARLQTIAAVLLGLALIAIPLYLWRRPRSDSPPITSEIDASAASALGSAAARAAAPPTLPQVTLSEPKVMECHDSGARRTRPEDCDHLAAVEKELALAISSAATCLPTAAGGGTLVYEVDVSFARKRKPIELIVPRDGRALKNARAAPHAVTDCTAAVKKGLAAVALEGVPHEHGRYKVAITATYAAPLISP